MDKKDVRLQKYISECGAASRRKAEALIAEGRVKVNGNTAEIGQSIVPRRDRVTLDGALLKMPDKNIYIALNKPRGYVTTLKDELGRKCVTELLKDIGARVYPVGRLDRDSEGLLLLTNDGNFANAVTHPAHHIQKVYRVSVRPGITQEQLAAIENGIEIDGRVTAHAKARLIREESGRAVAEITLIEGRNREIRKMCESLGLEVLRLNRISIGTVRLGGLPSGEYRYLDHGEVNSLLKASRPERKLEEHCI